MTGYARGESDFAAADRFRRDARPASLAAKDYSVPLHVDCSIEYELPDCAKPPQGVKIEPLLMIHPSHFRRLESLRRVPFVNNLPRGGGEATAAAAAAPARAAAPGGGAGGTRATRAPRRCCRAAPAPAAPQPAPAQAQRQRVPAAAAAAAVVPDTEAAAALVRYRFESFAADAGAGGGKLCARGSGARPRTRLKPHPYLALPLPLHCDMARALPTPYDRFDQRTLQQLPIYM